MEIYDHNRIHGQTPPPSPPAKSALRWVSVALSAAALLLALAALIVALLPEKDVRRPDAAETFAAVRPSVAEVFGGSKTGSGVVYAVRGGKTYVLTNYHVVRETSAPAVCFTDRGEKAASTLVGYDEYHDIALLCVEGDYGAKPVAFAEKPKTGESVLAVGNNLGKGIAAFDGIVSHTDRMLSVISNGTEKVVPVYAVTSPVNAGMSGGGIFTLDGKLLGIGTYQSDTAGSDDRTVYGMNYMVPGRIAALLAQRIEKQSTGKQAEKIDIAGNVRAENTIDCNGLYFSARFGSDGLTVASVLYAEPPLELRGDLQTGDVITQIGNLPVTAQTSFCDIFAECLRFDHDPSLRSQALTLTLRRGETTVTATYENKRLRYGA